MAKHKHFTINDRIEIEHSLKESLSFKAIARKLDRDCTSISKEVRKHITQKKVGAYGRAFNNCIHRFDCNHSYICDNPSCKNRYCRFCSKCSNVCSDFKEEICSLLSKPPYVCNGCSKLQKCTLVKTIIYILNLSRCRKSCYSSCILSFSLRMFSKVSKNSVL